MTGAKSRSMSRRDEGNSERAAALTMLGAKTE